jgi:ankyrin repeat protein
LHAGGQDNLSPLHDAVSSGSIPVVKILIEKGASKTSVDSKGYTPL